MYFYFENPYVKSKRKFEKKCGLLCKAPFIWFAWYPVQVKYAYDGKKYAWLCNVLKYYKIKEISSLSRGIQKKVISCYEEL